MGLDFISRESNTLDMKIVIITLFFLTAIVFERSVRKISDEYERLEALKIELVREKESEERRYVRLERQVMSQSDPNWIELTLIRVLGVVPEGHTKVYFKP